MRNDLDLSRPRGHGSEQRVTACMPMLSGPGSSVPVNFPLPTHPPQPHRQHAEPPADQLSQRVLPTQRLGQWAPQAGAQHAAQRGGGGGRVRVGLCMGERAWVCGSACMRTRRATFHFGACTAKAGMQAAMGTQVGTGRATCKTPTCTSSTTSATSGCSLRIFSSRARPMNPVAPGGINGRVCFGVMWFWWGSSLGAAGHAARGVGGGAGRGMRGPVWGPLAPASMGTAHEHSVRSGAGSRGKRSAGGGMPGHAGWWDAGVLVAMGPGAYRGGLSMTTAPQQLHLLHPCPPAAFDPRQAVPCPPVITTVAPLSQSLTLFASGSTGLLEGTGCEAWVEAGTSRTACNDTFLPPQVLLRPIAPPNCSVEHPNGRLCGWVATKQAIEGRPGTRHVQLKPAHCPTHIDDYF